MTLKLVDPNELPQIKDRREQVQKNFQNLAETFIRDGYEDYIVLMVKDKTEVRVFQTVTWVIQIVGILEKVKHFFLHMEGK